jgi:hypothetical protein
MICFLMFDCESGNNFVAFICTKYFQQMWQLGGGDGKCPVIAMIVMANIVAVVIKIKSKRQPMDMMAKDRSSTVGDGPLFNLFNHFKIVFLLLGIK